MKTIKDNDILFQENLARVLWPMNCEAEFSQIWSLLKKNRIKVFQLRSLSAKDKDKILRKLQKTSS